MPDINNASLVAQQYATSDGLRVRMQLHQKYSINRQPFADWIMAHYCIQPGMKVLELGCGTAAMWRDAPSHLPKGAELWLTDLSEGMLSEARGNVPALEGIHFAQVDVQRIPWSDDSFDMVIANMMLYHVPDLHKALAEIARVLKPDGRFICATVGENGVKSWLRSVLGCAGEPSDPFTMQNGAAALQQHFAAVESRLRKDGLAVTHTDDLTDYVLSMVSFSGLRSWPREQLTTLLNEQKTDGVIHIPKEYGLFICSSPKDC